MPPKLGAICGNNKSSPVEYMCALEREKDLYECIILHA